MSNAPLFRLFSFGLRYADLDPLGHWLAAEINKQYPTLLSPNAILLGLYWVVVYALQIGFCLILVTARKDETKVSLRPSCVLTRFSDLWTVDVDAV